MEFLLLQLCNLSQNLEATFDKAFCFLAIALNHLPDQILTRISEAHFLPGPPYPTQIAQQKPPIVQLGRVPYSVLSIFGELKTTDLDL